MDERIKRQLVVNGLFGMVLYVVYLGIAFFKLPARPLTDTDMWIFVVGVILGAAIYPLGLFFDALGKLLRERLAKQPAGQ